MVQFIPNTDVEDFCEINIAHRPPQNNTYIFILSILLFCNFICILSF